MEATFVVAIIERDIAEKLAVTVLLHEIPVLEMVHKNATIRPADIEPLVVSREIDPDEEYERLANQYGEDENGIPHVERVYGRQDEFVDKIENMYAHQAKAQKAKPRRNAPQSANTDAGDQEDKEDESNAG
jgi:hypothetical protein